MVLLFISVFQQNNYDFYSLKKFNFNNNYYYQIEIVLFEKGKFLFYSIHTVYIF